jgi:hypothetical protein
MSKNKNRLPPFVPLLVSTLDTKAWKAMSHGARSLYVALKRRVHNGRNLAFLPHRHAEAELGSTRKIIAKWFKELEHYGFIVMVRHGCLGVDGKGKSPQYRLTELGQMKGLDGLPELPSRDFLRWDGSGFEKTESRGTRVRQCGGHGYATSGVKSTPPKPAGGGHGYAIQDEPSGGHVYAITSIPLSNGSPLSQSEGKNTQVGNGESEGATMIQNAMFLHAAELVLFDPDSSEDEKQMAVRIHAKRRA